MENNKHFETLKNAINLMRFVNTYCTMNCDIVETFDIISNITADSDFDFEITYRGYSEALGFTIWVDGETVKPYINLWRASDETRKEFCEKFDLPCVEWVKGIQIAEKVANGEF